MKANILIIDDEEDILIVLTRWLKSNGFNNVTTVSSPEKALSALEQEWSLVITDIYLPGLDGIDYAKLVHEKHQNTKVLVMTANLSTEVTLRALDTRVDGFLSKPFDPVHFISKVEELLEPPKRKRVLAIGAHPDDVEIGCGGILVSHRNAGNELCILTLSSGSCGGETSTRVKEAEAAAKQLGAELHFGNLEDTKITEGPETIEVISKIVNQFSPDMIYTHSVHDAHQDHRNTNLATVVAARHVQSIESYQSPSSTIEFMPSHFVDIRETLEEKQALINCYESQWQKCRYLNRSLISATAEYWGRFSGYGIVEPLEVIRSS